MLKQLSKSARRKFSKAARAMTMITLMGASTIAFGQASTGSLSGTVVDSSGAVISGATVDIENAATGIKRTVSTNESGQYSAPNLEPGSYNIIVSATGFANTTTQGVQITVSFTTTAMVELKPAGVEGDVVNVSGGDNTIQINTTDQQLSTLINNEKILQLPLLSRDPNALVLLSPGVLPANSGLGGFAVNGSRERNNNFQVNGVDNNDTEVPGIPGGVSTPNIDATQEFRVITSNFNAEYGRNTGAIINVSLRSGTNEFHGGVYEFNRTDSFGARNFFDGADKTPLKRNQFGGSIGGPIIKNKLFFFGNYEKDIFNIGFANISIVPSATARQGILTNTPFGKLDIRPTGANNAMGFSFNPAILQVINTIYPLGNDAVDSPFPGTFDAFRFLDVNKTRSDQVNGRVDYQLSQLFNISTSYTFSRSDAPGGSGTFPGLGDVVSSLQRSSLLAINVTSVIRPTIVNEFRFGFNRVNAPFNGQGTGGVSTKLDDTIRAAFAANGVPLNQQPFGTRNGQALNLGFGGITSLGSFDSQSRFTGTTTLADNASYIRGKHNFKGGIETRFVYSNSDTNFGRSEGLSFGLPSTFGIPILVDNSGKPLPTTGTAGAFQNYASTLYGLVAFQTQTQFFDKSGARTDGDLRGFRSHEIDFYLQDTWRIKPNLTLNYGLRYEYKGVPYEVNGLISTLVDQDPSGVAPTGGFQFSLVGKNSPNPGIQLYDDDYNNFAPRIGFAYDPFKKGKTSIRGGYGVFYDRVFGNIFGNARGNPPFNIGFQNIPLALNGDFNDTILQNVPRPPSLTVTAVANNGDELTPVLFPLKGRKGNNPFQKEFRTPYVQQFTFGIQQQLDKGLTLEVDYVGTKSTKILSVLDAGLTSVRRKNAALGLNNAVSTSLRRNYLNGVLNTAFNGAALNTTLGFATYHSMSVRITKTLTNEKIGTGQIQGVYTLAHSIDNSEDPLVATQGNRAFPRDSSGFGGGLNGERGDSGNDVRNRFVLNFIYQFPFKSSNKIVNTLIGGYEMAGIFQAQTGNPFSVFFNGISVQGNNLSGRAVYANTGTPLSVNQNVNPALRTGPLANLFLSPFVSSNLQFLLSGKAQQISRSAFRGPGFNTMDFSLAKSFSYKERHKFLLRGEAFNVFNHTNLGQPINNALDPLFGISTSAGPSRILQLSIRYNF